MQDSDKTREQLIEELQQLRKKNTELEDSERKFRILAESTDAQIAVMRGNKYVYGNQALLDYYGLQDLDDLLVTTVDDLTIGMIAPEELMRIAPQYESAMARGETHFRVDFQDMEGHWFQTHATQTELDGQEAFIAVMFDITELKRAQQEIGDSEKKFRVLAESTTAQISVMQDDRYVYGNQALLDYYGLQDLEELLLTTPADLMVGTIAPEELQRIAPIWEAELERGETHFRVEFQDTEGTWFQTNATKTELDGKEAFIAMAFDITELKRAQTEMYRADKMAALGQIIAGVAHEINNPNNFIYFNLPILRRYIEAIAPLLEERLADDPDLKILNMPYAVFLEDVFKLLQNMEHGSERITGIVSELKTYVRSDEEQVRKVEPVEPAVDRVMTLVGKQVRKMVKHFDVDVADGLPAVEMDTGKIEQVLINLVINAGQAADKDDSWVKLSARPATEGGVELLVEDNGAGISEANLEKIFEPFFTSKGRDQGTGLGLSISHRIVEEHGGTLTVDSTPGEGTCFTVRLPAAAATA
jgi:PAS domain S-box-containing protein